MPEISVIVPVYKVEPYLRRCIDSILAQTFKPLLLVNPVTAPVEVFRYALLGQGTIVPWALCWSWAITLAVALLGILIFNRVEKTFMDTV